VAHSITWSERGRDVEVERLAGFEVDGELESRRVLDGEVAQPETSGYRAANRLTERPKSVSL